MLGLDPQRSTVPCSAALFQNHDSVSNKTLPLAVSKFCNTSVHIVIFKVFEWQHWKPPNYKTIFSSIFVLDQDEANLTLYSSFWL